MGWTGISHNQGIVEGSQIFICLQDCDLSTNPICTGTGPTGKGTINDTTFGPPLPLSTGGVPVCVINEYRGDVTLVSANLSTGDIVLNVPLTSKVHQGATVTVPCPICNGDATVGASGTYVNCGPNNTTCTQGAACTVDGLSGLGNTSTVCLPNPGNNIGNLKINLNTTSGTSTLIGM